MGRDLPKTTEQGGGRSGSGPGCPQFTTTWGSAGRGPAPGEGLGAEHEVEEGGPLGAARGLLTHQVWCLGSLTPGGRMTQGTEAVAPSWSCSQEGGGCRWGKVALFLTTFRTLWWARGRAISSYCCRKRAFSASQAPSTLANASE